MTQQNDPNTYGNMPVPPPSDPGALVAFGSYDQEAATAEAEQASKDASGGDWYNLKDGPNVLRILPPRPGGRSPFRIRWRHWLDLPNGESVKFNCPQKMTGEHCPVCERAEQMKTSADRTERDRGYAMSPQRQAIATVIDRSNPDKGPQLVQFPGKSVYDPLVNMRNDPRGGGDFTHPLSGFDVIIKRSGSGKKKTRYEVLPDRNNSQLADTVEQMNDWIMSQPDIAAYCGAPTSQEIRDMISEAMGTGGQAQPNRAAPAAAPMIGGAVPAAARPAAQPPAGQSAAQQMHQPPAYAGDDDIPF